MKGKSELLIKYGQAVEYLPPRLRNTAMARGDDEKEATEEFRLRVGTPFSIVRHGVEVFQESCGAVRREELQTVLELATKSSVHTAQSALKNGYITVSGGHRIGVCGTAIENGGEICGIRDISSVSIRIAKEIKTAAKELFSELFASPFFENTLIISPPGYGKTTMLRDLVRRISDKGVRVSLVDERGEVAAKHESVPQFDVGRCTDILDGAPKALGSMLLLRAMSPEIIAFDEITATEDVDAIFSITNCGVGIIATAHGENEKSLTRRPLYRKLLNSNIFKNIVILKREDRAFSYRLMSVNEVKI